MKTINHSASFIKISIIVFLVFMLLSKSFSQEESFPCMHWNKELKNITSKDSLNNLYIFGCTTEGSDGLASSFLKAGGTPPAIPEPTEENEIPDDSEYVNWTCKYAPGNVSDKDPATAWVEGVEGNGIGEVLIVPCLDLAKPAQIWSGYGKSENLHKANSRPKTICVFILQAEFSGAAQYGEEYKNLKIIAKQNLNLKDTNEYQEIEIPTFKKRNYYSEVFDLTREYNYILGIEIVDVYPGSKYQDCCISEIINL